MPSPQGYTAETPPGGVTEASYTSGSLSLSGWLSAPGPSKQPGVVFLHGGFSFSSQDWAETAPLSDAGFRVFMPKLRGENGGPGYFEMFGGEVDDAVAAGQFLATRPGVDSSHVYVIGHSVGGSLALLAALSDSPYRSAASLAGNPSLGEWIRERADLAPFQLSEDELNIRDPIRFASHLQIPTLLVADRGSPDLFPINRRFISLTAKGYTHARAVTVDGNHQTMIEPGIREAIAFFRSRSYPMSGPPSPAKGRAQAALERLRFYRKNEPTLRVWVSIGRGSDFKWRKMEADSLVKDSEVHAYLVTYPSGEVVDVFREREPLPEGVTFMEGPVYSDVRPHFTKSKVANEVVRITHAQSPVRPADPEYYSTTITNSSNQPIRCFKFAPLEKKWGLFYSGDPVTYYSPKQFREWYRVPDSSGWIAPGTRVVDPNNWGTGAGIWAYFFERQDGEWFVATATLGPHPEH